MTWLTGWNKRKQITVTGSTAGAQSDYQMEFTVNQGSGADSAGIVYLGGNILSTFNDLRFTKSDGTTTLYYWIESITGTSPNEIATVWIKLAPFPDTIPISPGTYNFYIYYNNPSATTSVSNGTNTFILFDDFLGSSINPSIWSLYAPGYSSGPGTITVSNSVVMITGSTNTWWALASRNVPTINIPFKIEYLAKCINGTNGSYEVGACDPSTGFGHDSMQFSTSGSVCYSTVNNTVETRDPSPTPEYTSWTRLGMDVRSGSVDFYVNGSLVHTNTTNIPDEAMGARFMAAQRVGTVYVDWVHISKYVFPEPTTYIGGEEVSTTTIYSVSIYPCETPCRTGICTW